MDEQWGRVYCKGTPCWLWHAIDHDTGDVIAFVIGSRKQEMCQRLWDALIALNAEIPISHTIIKTRATEEQKTFHNFYLKKENVKDAFKIKNPEIIKGKNILLIDDIFDSGKTISEIGSMLTKSGAKSIMPLVIAKTVAGDKL